MDSSNERKTLSTQLHEVWRHFTFIAIANSNYKYRLLVIRVREHRLKIIFPASMKAKDRSNRATENADLMPDVYSPEKDRKQKM